MTAGMRDRLAGLLVDDLKDDIERLALRFGNGPTGIAFGDRAHVIDQPIGIDCNDAAADRIERDFGQLFFAVRRIFKRADTARYEPGDKRADQKQQRADDRDHEKRIPHRHAGLRNGFQRGRPLRFDDLVKRQLKFIMGRESLAQQRIGGTCRVPLHQ